MTTMIRAATNPLRASPRAFLTARTQAAPLASVLRRGYADDKKGVMGKVGDALLQRELPLPLSSLDPPYHSLLRPHDFRGGTDHDDTIAGEEKPDSESSTVFKTPESIRPDKSKLAEQAGTGKTIEGGKGETEGPGAKPQGVVGN